MGVILGVFGMIFLGLIVRLLSVEIGLWHRPLCHWLVRRAARRLPEDERADVESEWLSIIEDLRSPTTQLLHSLSFAFSAVRIQREIDPSEARASAYARGLIFGQGSAVAVLAGLIAGLLAGGEVQSRLSQLLSSPTHIAGVFAAFLVLFYINYRLLMWNYKRRERQSADVARRRD